MTTVEPMPAGDVADYRRIVDTFEDDGSGMYHPIITTCGQMLDYIERLETAVAGMKPTATPSPTNPSCIGCGDTHWPWQHTPECTERCPHCGGEGPDLDHLMVSLAEAWPTARLYTEGRAVLAILPTPPGPGGPGSGGRPLDDAGMRAAADELLDRLEQRTADIGPSGGTSILSAAERRRRTWRESKARARAKARAVDSEAPHMRAPGINTSTTAPLSTTSTDVHMSTVDTSTECGHSQVTAGVDSVDVHPSPPEPPLTVGCKNNNGAREARATRPRLPGLDGPMPEEHRTRPDDLLRRRLAVAVPAVLARAALDAALARGTDIRSPQAYTAATAKRIAVAQAPGIRDAVETALARWGTATTPTHVAERLAACQAAAKQAPNSGNHEKAGQSRDELTAARQLATTWARTGLTPSEVADGIRHKFPTLTPTQIAEATAA